ncbi:MAG: Alpha/beta hydrolase fold-3 domain protein [Labilithrix sp.]|nr:Alpha/beta hydrolase fold-3 domain protein [Labilithrix sp.]
MPRPVAKNVSRPDPLPRRRLVDRALGRVAAALSLLPPRVQIMLSGGKPIVKDGEALAPDVQLILAAEARRGPMTFTSPDDLRRQQRSGSSVAGGVGVAVGSVKDLAVDGGAGRLKARHYAPLEPAGAPLLLFLHGGGFVFGDLDTHDASCRMLCRYGGFHVLAVDYRLSPEHSFPAAVDDGRAALRWAQEHAAELGADPARVGIGGDSAGGNLSAVIAQMAAADGGPPPVLQMLIYPAVDRTKPYPSLDLFANGFFLTRESIDWFHERYAGRSGVQPGDPRIGPLHATSFAGLPPALVVTAGFDPLRDEGEAYAAALAAAGNVTVVRRFGTLIHGFFNMVGISPSSRDAVLEIASATRTLFAVAAAHKPRGVAASKPRESGALPS